MTCVVTGGAVPEVVDVVERLLDKRRDMVIVGGVEDAVAVPSGGHDSGGAQLGQVMRYRRCLHRQMICQLADRVLAVEQVPDDPQPRLVHQQLQGPDSRNDLELRRLVNYLHSHLNSLPKPWLDAVVISRILREFRMVPQRAHGLPRDRAVDAGHLVPSTGRCRRPVVIVLAPVIATGRSVPFTSEAALPEVTSPPTVDDPGADAGGHSAGGDDSVDATAPLREADAADPFVVVDDGRAWLSTTNSAAGNVPVVAGRGADGVVVSDALPVLPTWAAPGFTWAPAVTSTDDGWALAFTARHQASGRQCIGVATSTTINGHLAGVHVLDR